MEMIILGEKLEVVQHPSGGAFEPDYDAFFDELHKKSVLIRIDGVRWRLSVHTDFSNPKVVVIRLKSLGNEYLDFRNYGLEFMIDTEELALMKFDDNHINKMIVYYFKEHPIIQKMFAEYVEELEVKKIG